MINIGEFTSFQTDNFASEFIEMKSDGDVETFLDQTVKFDSFYVIGGGTNLLLSSPIYDNVLFVRNVQRGFVRLSDDTFKVKAGENLMAFIKYLINDCKINTFDPMYGLPGSVGGAVMGNAGSFGVNIGPYVQSVIYLDENRNLVEDKNYKYLYRESNLKGRKILLLDVVLKVPTTKLADQKDHIWYMNRRVTSQEYTKTCGSYFKNIKLSALDPKLEKIGKIENNPLSQLYNQGKDIFTIPAGWLVEQVGMKGFELNWVKFSNKHANFIINYDNKDPNNILKIADIAKEKVFENFGLNLEEEVIIL